MPNTQVTMFQMIAPISAAKITVGETMPGSMMPGPERLCDMQPGEQKGDEIEEGVAQATANCGLSTRVDTIVAIELAASCRLSRSKNERDCDQPGKQQARVASIDVSITMPLISLATSSKRSTTFSSSPADPAASDIAIGFDSVTKHERFQAPVVGVRSDLSSTRHFGDGACTRCIGVDALEQDGLRRLAG